MYTKCGCCSMGTSDRPDDCPRGSGTVLARRHLHAWAGSGMGEMERRAGEREREREKREERERKRQLKQNVTPRIDRW